LVLLRQQQQRQKPCEHVAQAVAAVQNAEQLLQAVHAVAPTCRRRKLPLLSVAQLDALLGPAGPQDVLLTVCLLASWNPVCTKLEHYELQGAHYELLQQAAAAKQLQDKGGAAQTGSSGRDGSGDGCSSSSSSVKLGVDAANIKVRQSAVLLADLCYS
jgi:thioesterase domain-containing protein